MTGTIPTQLGNLTQLQTLTLSPGQLTGSIPTQLGNLTQLTNLYLANNQLSGSIPAELGNLRQPAVPEPFQQSVDRFDPHRAGRPRQPAIPGFLPEPDLGADTAIDRQSRQSEVANTLSNNQLQQVDSGGDRQPGGMPRMSISIPTS